MMVFWNTLAFSSLTSRVMMEGINQSVRKVVKNHECEPHLPGPT